MKENTKKYGKLLKIILWIYILLCVVIAGVNYGYAARAPENVQKIITWVWLIYENWVKTLFILICAFLTLKMIGGSQRTEMRKKNLIGFILAALVVHVLAPLITANYELYFFAMPLPWTTTALQLYDSNAPFYHNMLTAWGPSGIVSALLLFAIANLTVFLGTLLLGRRFQCSSICLFNGFAAEVFDPVIPLLGKKKKMKPSTLRLLGILRWIYLAIALFFVFLWILHLLGVIASDPINLLAKIETYKYLAGELLLMMFFWIAFIGRGYCYLCPLGTTLGLLAKLADQKITTDNTTCVKCGKCNLACPMTIDIKSRAVEGLEVKNLNCVGCGHCVDACPTKNLNYSTKFLNRIGGKRKPE